MQDFCNHYVCGFYLRLFCSLISTCSSFLRTFMQIILQVENLDPLVQRAITGASAVPDLRGTC